MPGIDKTENEFRFRIKDPKLFMNDTFRYKYFKEKDGKKTGVAIVVGKLKDPPEGHEGSMVTQAYRFARDKFKKATDIRGWLNKHKIKGVNEMYASEIFIKEAVGQDGKREGVGGTSKCVCPKCGNEVGHPRSIPCNTMSCSKCGTKMTGEGTPGSKV